LTFNIVSQEVTLTHPEWVGKTIQEMEFTERYACYLTCLSRSGIELSLDPGTQLERGDVLTLSSPQSRLEALADQIGDMERDVNTTDLVTFAAGIGAGFLIRQISLKVGGLSIGLGTAGGLLLMGLVLGRFIPPLVGFHPRTYAFATIFGAIACSIMMCF
jgi:putative transport protein